MERAKSSGNFSGVSLLHSGNQDKDDEEDALEEQVNGEPLKKRVKM